MGINFFDAKQKQEQEEVRPQSFGARFQRERPERPLTLQRREVGINIFQCVSNVRPRSPEGATSEMRTSQYALEEMAAQLERSRQDQIAGEDDFEGQIPLFPSPAS